MGKKAVVKMSLTEFTGGDTGNTLPTQSEGKDFGKSKGKGLRDMEDSRAELSDWRGGGGGKGDRGDRDGGGKGGGLGRGPRRDEAPSRSDEGDWFAKDRPARGDGDDRPRGGFGGGDRDRGGGGGMRDGERERRGGGNDTNGEKDADWRGGMGRNAREENDRDGDRGGRRRDEDSSRSGPAERPRLALKPRSKPLPGQDELKETPANDGDKAKSNPFGAARPGREDAKEEERRRKEEEPPRRRADEDAQRKADDEDRSARRKESGSNTSKPGAYVPPAQRKSVDDQQKKQEEAEARAAKEEDEKKRRAEKEKAEKDSAKKRLKQEAKEAEAQAMKEATSKGTAKPPQPKDDKTGKPSWSEEKISTFSHKCAVAIDNGSADIEALVNDAPSLLGQSELQTIQPMSQLLQHFLKHCRRKTEDKVVSAVERFAPLFNCLISSAEVHRFKIKVLCEAQKLIYDMGLPRLSPESSLIEVFFDALYRSEIIEEDYFHMWAINNDDTPGKNKAMFQVNDFLDWLRNAGVEGEESDSEDDDKEKEEGDEDDDDDEDSDIESMVPKSAGARLR